MHLKVKKDFPLKDLSTLGFEEAQGFFYKRFRGGKQIKIYKDTRKVALEEILDRTAGSHFDEELFDIYLLISSKIVVPAGAIYE